MLVGSNEKSEQDSVQVKVSDVQGLAVNQLVTVVVKVMDLLLLKILVLFTCILVSEL